MISTRKLCIIYISSVLAFAFLAYMLISPNISPYMTPLPFDSSLWKRNIDRTRMVESVKEMVIGLSEEEVIELLGSPASILHPPWHGIPPGLDYRIGTERNLGPDRRVFLVIHFDENMIAYSTRIARF